TPSPARVLEAPEVPKYTQAPNAETICSLSGNPANTFVQLAGEIHSFCGHVHAEDWINVRTAASALETPGGDVPVGESPYTEGRKRLLCLLPIWLDFPNPAMTTNYVMTNHFVNFSNYMIRHHVVCRHGRIRKIQPNRQQ